MVTPHIAYITKGVVGALAFMHSELNIIHCDIKPENILISQAGQVKVADLGLSCKNSDQDKGHGKGTLHYMAPEVVNSGQYSYEVDIWSVGITVFALAEGALPYYRVARDNDELRTIISKSVHTPKLPKRYPEIMRFFVQCCLLHESSRPAAKQLLTHPWLLNACSQEDMAHLMKLICR
jgi:serine/threonine protein kinase